MKNLICLVSFLWVANSFAGPGNDLFADRIELTTPTYHVEGDIYGASTELGEPLPPDTSQTVWWKFTAPSAGELAVWPSTPQFTPALTLYEGIDLASLVPVIPLNNYRYTVQAGHAYALQMAAACVSAAAFTLDTQFFPMTNDFFLSSTRLAGTNITFTGDFSSASFEPGEPNPGATNTIWMSWAAPFNGRARYSLASKPSPQYVGLYTGAALDRLVPVHHLGTAHGHRDFLTVEGTVYQKFGVRTKFLHKMPDRRLILSRLDIRPFARMLALRYGSEAQSAIPGSDLSRHEPRRPPRSDF